MTYYPVSSPYPIFSDDDGTPLEDGYIYIGEAYQNPITNPITISWDNAGLYPIAQPIRTISGYPDRNGSPGTIHINSGTYAYYSIMVQDKNGETVYSNSNVPVNESIESIWVYNEDQMLAADTAGRTIILLDDITLTASYTPSVPIDTNGYTLTLGTFDIDFTNQQPKQLTNGCFNQNSTGSVTNLSYADPAYWGGGPSESDSTNSAAITDAADSLADNGVLEFNIGGQWQHDGLTFGSGFSYKTMKCNQANLYYTGTASGVEVIGTALAYVNGAKFYDLHLTSAGAAYSAGQHHLELQYTADCDFSGLIENARDYGLYLHGANDRHKMNFVILYSKGWAAWLDSVDGTTATTKSNGNTMVLSCYDNANGIQITSACYGNNIDFSNEAFDDGYSIQITNGRKNIFYSRLVEDNARQNDNIVEIASVSYGNMFIGGVYAAGTSTLTPTIFYDAGVNTVIDSPRVLTSVAGSTFVEAASSVRGGAYLNFDDQGSAVVFGAPTFNSSAVFRYIKDGYHGFTFLVDTDATKRVAKLTSSSGPVVTYEDDDAAAGLKRVDAGQQDGIFYIYRVTDDLSTREVMVSFKNDSTIHMVPLSSAPSTPIEGDLAMADRVNWDPLAVGAGGSYLVWYDGSSWTN